MAPIDMPIDIPGFSAGSTEAAIGISGGMHGAALVLGSVATVIGRYNQPAFVGIAWGCLGLCANFATVNGTVVLEPFSIMMAFLAGTVGYMSHVRMLKVLTGVVAALLAIAALRLNDVALTSTTVAAGFLVPIYELTAVVTFVSVSMTALMLPSYMDKTLVDFNSTHLGVLLVISGCVHFAKYAGTSLGEEFSFLDQISFVLTGAGNQPGSGLPTAATECGEFCRDGLLGWIVASWALLGYLYARSGDRCKDYMRLPHANSCDACDADEENQYETKTSPVAAKSAKPSRDMRDNDARRAGPPASSPAAGPSVSQRHSGRKGSKNGTGIPGPTPCTAPARDRQQQDDQKSAHGGSSTRSTTPVQTEGMKGSASSNEPFRGPSNSPCGSKDEKWVADRMKGSKQQQVKREFRSGDLNETANEKGGSDAPLTGEQWATQRLDKLRKELRELKGKDASARRSRLRVLQLELHPDKHPPEMRPHAQSLFHIVQREWQMFDQPTAKA